MPQLSPSRAKRRAPARRPLRSVVVVMTLGVSLSLAGCVSGGHPLGWSVRTSSPGRVGGTATSGATATPSPPSLIPGGTAQQNLPYFDQVNRATLAADPNAKGRDFIDALVAAGFRKDDMQVTADTTTIGLKANSIQFSVRLGETCLIGQNGADAGGYNSQVTPVLATGACLIGDTRPIDW